MLPVSLWNSNVLEWSGGCLSVPPWIHLPAADQLHALGATCISCKQYCQSLQPLGPPLDSEAPSGSLPCHPGSFLCFTRARQVLGPFEVAGRGMKDIHGQPLSLTPVSLREGDYPNQNRSCLEDPGTESQHGPSPGSCFSQYGDLHTAP